MSQFFASAGQSTGVGHDWASNIPSLILQKNMFDK